MEKLGSMLTERRVFNEIFGVIRNRPRAVTFRSPNRATTY